MLATTSLKPIATVVEKIHSSFCSSPNQPNELQFCKEQASIEFFPGAAVFSSFLDWISNRIGLSLSPGVSHNQEADP